MDLAALARSSGLVPRDDLAHRQCAGPDNLNPLGVSPFDGGHLDDHRGARQRLASRPGDVRRNHNAALVTAPHDGHRRERLRIEQRRDRTTVAPHVDHAAGDEAIRKKRRAPRDVAKNRRRRHDILWQRHQPSIQAALCSAGRAESKRAARVGGHWKRGRRVALAGRRRNRRKRQYPAAGVPRATRDPHTVRVGPPRWRSAAPSDRSSRERPVRRRWPFRALDRSRCDAGVRGLRDRPRLVRIRTPTGPGARHARGCAPPRPARPCGRFPSAPESRFH